MTLSELLEEPSEKVQDLVMELLESYVEQCASNLDKRLLMSGMGKGLILLGHNMLGNSVDLECETVLDAAIKSLDVMKELIEQKRLKLKRDQNASLDQEEGQ